MSYEVESQNLTAEMERLQTWTEEGAIETPHTCEAAIHYPVYWKSRFLQFHSLIDVALLIEQWIIRKTQHTGQCNVFSSFSFAPALHTTTSSIFSFNIMIMTTCLAMVCPSSAYWLLATGWMWDTDGPSCLHLSFPPNPQSLVWLTDYCLVFSPHSAVCLAVGKTFVQISVLSMLP